MIERKIARLHPALKVKVRAAFDLLSEEPYVGKALKEDLLGLYSYRVARYRIVYRIHARVIEVHILAVGHRRDIYQSVLP